MAGMPAKPPLSAANGQRDGLSSRFAAQERAGKLALTVAEAVAVVLMERDTAPPLDQTSDPTSGDQPFST